VKSKTGKSLRKAESAIYKLLSPGGRQSELHIIIEYVISAMICLNVILIVFESVLGMDGEYRLLLIVLREFFFAFFLIEYILRVWIADMVMRDRKHPVKSRLRYMLTFRAVIDLLALLPVLIGSTFIDFRIFRVLRLLRITQLKTLSKYTDTLRKVIKLKGSQLLAAIFIVFIFMLASAVIIYDLEHAAQPELFKNVLSGLWWSVSAITTIGYGDMYPVTVPGRVFGSLMSVFGVLLMAVPIAILTSGFFELSKKPDHRTNADKTKTDAEK
jgi:voltage-gated potassium channel